MYAIKVEKLFGKDWKDWDENYLGCEHQFTYNGIEYLPLSEVIKTNFILQAWNIEDLDMEANNEN